VLNAGVESLRSGIAQYNSPAVSHLRDTTAVALEEDRFGWVEVAACLKMMAVTMAGPASHDVWDRPLVAMPLLIEHSAHRAWIGCAVRLIASSGWLLAVGPLVV